VKDIELRPLGFMHELIGQAIFEQFQLTGLRGTKWRGGHRCHKAGLRRETRRYGSAVRIHNRFNTFKFIPLRAALCPAHRLNKKPTIDWQSWASTAMGYSVRSYPPRCQM